MSHDWLFDRFPRYISARVMNGSAPNNLFQKTIPSGLLYLVGEWFFSEFLAISDDVLFCDTQTAFDRSAAVYFLLVNSGVKNSLAISKLWLAIDDIDEVIQEVPKKRWNSVVHRKGLETNLSDALFEVYEIHKQEMNQLRAIYSKNFSERAFHDRQLCEYVSFVLKSLYRESGYPVKASLGALTYSRIERKKWPAWLRPTLLARERNACANCGVSFAELHEEAQLDHIVPLSDGGNNDLVNLQLLCSGCNLRKSNDFQLVKSSIPNYFSWKKISRKQNNS
jgi:hypothetical protein